MAIKISNSTIIDDSRVITNPSLVLIGTATSTGAVSQPLQVNGGAYVSNSLGVGNTLTSSAGSGQIIGGFGAYATSGTLDWNDITNARSGNGYTLLLGSATNGPGASYPYYYHPFSFEYTNKNGTGNLTQLAIPYANDNTSSAPGIFYRGKYLGTWNSWYRTLSQPASITGINIDSSGNLLVNNTSATGTASQPLQVTGGAYVSGSLGVGLINPGQAIDVSGSIRASSQLISTVSTGTAPFVVSSTTLVSNLNAQYANGFSVGGSNGNWWTKVPVVAADGVIEIGRYVDFHSTSGDTTDFTYRLDNSSAGVLVCSGSLSATTLTSTVSTGTAPFTVSSTTLVSNLNADLLDGLNSASTNTASTIVARDASGDFSAGTITATSLVKSGGTSSQFLKADGSVDTNTYITSASVGNGTLTLNVSGTGLSGSQTFTANQSGNATFTVTSNATSTNTASTIVARDASGNFSAGTITAALSGNASTATNLSTNNSNWSSNGTISAVVGQLSWKNYGNGHTIFDSSNSTSPAGGSVNNTNPDVAWSATYPTLMGWNGANTYGVRVDSARYSEYLNGLASGSFLRSDTTTTWSGSAGGNFRIALPAGALGSTATTVNTLELYQSTVNTDAFLSFHVGGDYAAHFGIDGTTNDLFYGGWSLGAVKHRVWHAGNMGVGSGLNADLLDNLNSGTSGANVILRTDANGYLVHQNWIQIGDGTGLYAPSGAYFYEDSSGGWFSRSRIAGSSSIKLQTSNGTARGWLYADSSSQQGFLDTSGNWIFRLENSGNCTHTGSVFPATDATYDLGSTSLRWNNIYTTDLQLSNEGSKNEVDGTWGSWTIQEGEEDLFIINRRSGKKYKFTLQEI